MCESVKSEKPKFRFQVFASRIICIGNLRVITFDYCPGKMNIYHFTNMDSTSIFERWFKRQTIDTLQPDKMFKMKTYGYIRIIFMCILSKHWNVCSFSLPYKFSIQFKTVKTYILVASQFTNKAIWNNSLNNKYNLICYWFFIIADKIICKWIIIGVMGFKLPMKVIVRTKAVIQHLLDNSLKKKYK